MATASVIKNENGGYSLHIPELEANRVGRSLEGLSERFMSQTATKDAIDRIYDDNGHEPPIEDSAYDLPDFHREGAELNVPVDRVITDENGEITHILVQIQPNDNVDQLSRLMGVDYDSFSRATEGADGTFTQSKDGFDPSVIQSGEFLAVAVGPNGLGLDASAQVPAAQAEVTAETAEPLTPPDNVVQEGGVAEAEEAPVANAAEVSEADLEALRQEYVLDENGTPTHMLFTVKPGDRLEKLAESMGLPSGVPLEELFIRPGHTLDIDKINAGETLAVKLDDAMRYDLGLALQDQPEELTVEVAEPEIEADPEIEPEVVSTLTEPPAVEESELPDAVEADLLAGANSPHAYVEGDTLDDLGLEEEAEPEIEPEVVSTLTEPPAVEESELPDAALADLLAGANSPHAYVEGDTLDDLGLAPEPAPAPQELTEEVLEAYIEKNYRNPTSGETELEETEIDTAAVIASQGPEVSYAAEPTPGEELDEEPVDALDAVTQMGEAEVSAADQLIGPRDENGVPEELNFALSGVIASTIIPVPMPRPPNLGVQVEPFVDPDVRTMLPELPIPTGELDVPLPRPRPEPAMEDVAAAFIAGDFNDQVGDPEVLETTAEPIAPPPSLAALLEGANSPHAYIPNDLEGGDTSDEPIDVAVEPQMEAELAMPTAEEQFLGRLELNSDGELGVAIPGGFATWEEHRTMTEDIAAAQFTLEQDLGRYEAKHGEAFLDPENTDSLVTFDRMAFEIDHGIKPEEAQSHLDELTQERAFLEGMPQTYIDNRSFVGNALEEGDPALDEAIRQTYIESVRGFEAQQSGHNGQYAFTRHVNDLVEQTVPAVGTMGSGFLWLFPQEDANSAQSEVDTALQERAASIMASENSQGVVFEEYLRNGAVGAFEPDEAEAELEENAPTHDGLEQEQVASASPQP